MEIDRKFLAMITELIDKVQSSPHACTSPAEGYLELDSSRLIKKFLPAAAHDNSRRAPTTLIESLRGSFSNPNNLLIEFMLETNRQKVSRDSLKSGPKDEFGLVKPNINLRGSFIVNVISASGPGKFYVLPCYKREAMDLYCMNPLQKLAPNSSLPVEIFRSQMYAVLNSDNKWSRALVGPPTGTFQVGDEPVETLYECFLLDFGSHERISQKSIRVLPKQFLDLPPFALECTMNVNFVPKIWSVTSTLLFKRWTSKGPMKMQIFAQQNGVLYVDLLDSCGDDKYVSIRDCLMYLEEPPPFVAPKQFKPKYLEIELEKNPLKEAVVIITNSSQPSEMYVQVVDDDVALYQQMKKELQLEFSSTTASVSPVVGHPYAALHENEWSRVLIELWGSDIVAFHVDTGLRQHIYPNTKFHTMPDRYLEIPAQAVRCSLHGVFPVSNLSGSLRNSVESFPIDLHLFMAQYEAKSAVAIFVDWQAGVVGYLEGSPFQELTANVVLYPDGDVHSINVQVGQTPMALLGDEQIELPEHLKIRRVLQQRSNKSSNTEENSSIPAGSLKVSIASAIENPSKVTQTLLAPNQAPKISSAPVSSKPATSSATKFALLPSISVRPTSAKTGSEINTNQPCKPVIKKYQPKFSSFELRSNPLKYAAVTITKVTQPRSMYIRIDDDDAPRYLQLLKELELEFRSASNTSRSYCSSPIVGLPYAIQYGTRWQRCLIESSRDRQLTIFFVDTGLREVLRPAMMFHELPERFLELPAQSVRCSLYGVDPPRNPDGSSGWKFPSEAYSFLLRFNGKPAVAFFNHWKAGQVGRCSSTSELEARVVIYPKDELISINKQICFSPKTALLADELIEQPEHFQIQCNLAAPKSSELSVAVEKKEASIRANPSPDASADVARISSHKTAQQNKKYQPKLGHHQLNSNPLRYANVFITSATLPKLIYIQLIDEDVPRYRRMDEELQIEFRSATMQSSASPVVGNAYAVQLRDHWYRVLINSYSGRTMVFFVDVGRRQPFNSTMMIQNLPDKFMELPAQAVRCRLQGVFPPRNSDGSIRSAFPQTALDCLRRFENKPAAAYFHEWYAGQVGYFPDSLRELQADVILYLRGDDQTINMQITKRSVMARLVDQPPKLANIHRTLKILAKTSSIISVGSSSSKILEVTDETAAALPMVAVSDPIHCTPNQQIDIGRNNDPGASSSAKSSEAQAVPALAPAVSFPIPPKKEEEIAIPITFVGCTSPEEVFFRNRELAKEFFSLQNALYSYFETHKESVEEPINFDVGFVCAVNCDGRWYRAEMTDIGNYPEINVVLLDKGCSRSVSTTEIRRLPDGLDQPECMVIRVSFYGNPSHSGTGWNPNLVTHHINNRLYDAEKITMRCRKPSQLTPKLRVKTLPVTIHLSSNRNVPVNLNAELAFFGSFGSTPISGIARRGARRTVWKSAELPKIGETFWAKVTWINHKGEFFLQDVCSQPELDSIQKQLNENYKDSLPADADLCCAQGDLCIARYKDSNDWRRGVIVSQVDNEKVEVYFADYGTADLVDIRNIRLNLLLRKIPVQVVRCSLYNVKPVGDDAQKWNLDQLSAFNLEAVGREFRVTVMSAGPPLQVEMVYSAPRSRNFNRELVFKGLAEFVNRNID